MREPKTIKIAQNKLKTKTQRKTQKDKKDNGNSPSQDDPPTRQRCKGPRTAHSTDDDGGGGTATAS